MKLNIKQIRLKQFQKILIIEENNFNSIDKIIDKVALNLCKNKLILMLYPNNNNDLKTLELSKKLMQLASEFDSMFLIKNRLDISKIIDLDGIVLDFNSIDIINAIKLLGDDKIFVCEQNNACDKINNIDKFDLVFNKSNCEILER